MTLKEQRAFDKRITKLEMRVKQLERPLPVVHAKSKKEKMKDEFRKQFLKIA